MTICNRPWRKVVGKPRLREGRGSVLGPATHRRNRWWELELECGHETCRFVRYRPLPGPPGANRGNQERSRDDVLPPPQRVRCEFCES